MVVKSEMPYLVGLHRLLLSNRTVIIVIVTTVLERITITGQPCLLCL